jgi:hypothetical protein
MNVMNIGRKPSWGIIKYYSSNFLERMRKTTKISGRLNCFSGPVSNQGAPGYEDNKY